MECNAYMNENESLNFAKLMQFVSTEFGNFGYKYFNSMAIGINHHITINGLEFVVNFSNDTINSIDIWGFGFTADNILKNETINTFICWYMDNINHTNCFVTDLMGAKLVNVKMTND